MKIMKKDVYDEIKTALYYALGFGLGFLTANIIRDAF